MGNICEMWKYVILSMFNKNHNMNQNYVLADFILIFYWYLLTKKENFQENRQLGPKSSIFRKAAFLLWRF